MPIRANPEPSAAAMLAGEYPRVSPLQQQTCSDTIYNATKAKYTHAAPAQAQQWLTVYLLRLRQLGRLLVCLWLHFNAVFVRMLQ